VAGYYPGSRPYLIRCAACGHEGYLPTKTDLERIDRIEKEAIVGDKIHESVPGVVGVEFDEDGRHVYVAMAGEAVTRRYRLGQDVQRFLLGEFPLDGFDADLMITLEPPTDDEDQR
jgi:hypothetical protein